MKRFLNGTFGAFLFFSGSSLFANSPTITSTPILAVEKGKDYSYTLGANDLDGDSLTWDKRSSLPSWLNLNSSDLSGDDNSMVSTIFEASTNPIINSIDIDSSGNIYFYSNNEIKKIDSLGNLSSFTALVSSANTTAEGGLTIDSSGNIYVVDRVNRQIKKIDSSGNVTLFAGSGVQEDKDGLGSAAAFMDPVDIDIDSNGNLYVTDTGSKKIKKINSSGLVSTFLESSEIQSPTHITISDSGNIYLVDQVNQIMKIDSSKNVSSYILGNQSDVGIGISNAGIIGGIDIDSNENIYFSDFSGKIYKASSDRNVSILTGAAGVFGDVDGDASIAQINFPKGIALDSSGDIYIVASSGNRKIKKLTMPKSGKEYKLVGTPSNDDVGIHNVELSVSDGENEINHDFTITVAGDIPVITSKAITSIDENQEYKYEPKALDANSENLTWKIKEGTKLPSWLSLDIPIQKVSTFAGSGEAEVLDENGLKAKFSHPEGITSDSEGNIYLFSKATNSVRKITPGVVTEFHTLFCLSLSHHFIS